MSFAVYCTVFAVVKITNINITYHQSVVNCSSLGVHGTKKRFEKTWKLWRASIIVRLNIQRCPLKWQNSEKNIQKHEIIRLSERLLKISFQVKV